MSITYPNEEIPEFPIIPQWNAKILFCPPGDVDTCGYTALLIARTAIKRIKDRAGFKGELFYDIKDGTVNIRTTFQDMSAEEMWSFVHIVYGQFYTAIQETIEGVVQDELDDDFPQKPVNDEDAVKKQATGIRASLRGLVGLQKVEPQGEAKKNGSYESKLKKAIFQQGGTIDYVEKKIFDWGERLKRSNGFRRANI